MHTQYIAGTIFQVPFEIFLSPISVDAHLEIREDVLFLNGVGLFRFIEGKPVERDWTLLIVPLPEIPMVLSVDQKDALVHVIDQTKERALVRNGAQISITLFKNPFQIIEIGVYRFTMIRLS
ncbi:hypothetical protein COY32_05315 [candidate division WWE3 bacterium CG_4_10_14_0_2_um_filter_41_14]|uniref:Uncharacterized protein n=1 Tax=candidate division WWE3 bacterium CG_4_10_14_0_2_um_filter_41_14 TaxID=1975072 RepID=A0A2M7TGV6_UNCKA|nr:MAG: hypothetical protein COY32_05315 [candidate division WWE3 bacterium CG_4_10_14_0_2_um_filter_41_14]